MFLYINGDGLLNKVFEDENGRPMFRFRTKEITVNKLVLGPATHRTKMYNTQTGAYLGFVDWEMRQPICVSVARKTYMAAKIWRFMGKYHATKDQITFTTSRGLTWVLEQDTIKLVWSKRPKAAPILEYTKYREGQGGYFNDALTLTDDVGGIPMGEILAGWMLMERIRGFRWQINTIGPPLTKWESAVERLLDFTHPITMARKRIADTIQRYIMATAPVANNRKLQRVRRQKAHPVRRSIMMNPAVANRV